MLVTSLVPAAEEMRLDVLHLLPALSAVPTQSEAGENHELSRSRGPQNLITPPRGAAHCAQNSPVVLRDAEYAFLPLAHAQDATSGRSRTSCS